MLQSLDLFDSQVRTTPGDRWSAPSPCEGWTARDVVAHCVTNLRALRHCLDGGDFFAAFGQPVDGEIVEAWTLARGGVGSILDAAAEAGTETVVVGGNPVPLIAIIDGLMRDLVIHTWDLGRAVGGDERLPPDLVAAATDAMAMVTDAQRVPGLYGRLVEAPAAADAQVRLLALSGRKAWAD